MTKTFKSADSPLEMGVGVSATGDVQVSLGAIAAVTITPSNAPALALAILEAAGWPNEHLVTTEILRRLREFDKYLKAIEAEAREQAELEAEAFNLYRAYMAVHEPMNAIGDWKMLAERTKKKWLAVARRAREMAKEDNHA